MIIQNYIYDCWTLRWHQYEAARQTKQFYYSPSTPHAKELLKFDRWQVSKFVNLTSGHNNLAYHASIINQDVVDSGCSFCNTNTETFYHWANDCPALFHSRCDAFLDILPCNDMKWRVANILKFAKIPSLKAIIEGDMMSEETVD